MADLIRPCTDRDLEGILEVINDAAQAYKGVIPHDRFKEPYMPSEELRHQDRSMASASGVLNKTDSCSV